VVRVRLLSTNNATVWASHRVKYKTQGSIGSMEEEEEETQVTRQIEDKAQIRSKAAGKGGENGGEKRGRGVAAMKY
jgi:hypothetical protein